MDTSGLELYYMPTCPYCKKVLRFMDAHDIRMPLHDIMSDAHDHDYLAEHGGKVQVPCLFIDGEALYESDDIIEYLQDRL